MQRVEPEPTASVRGVPTPSRPHRISRGALSALGLLTLPVMGTVALVPSLAVASCAAPGTASVVWAAGTVPGHDEVAAAEDAFAAAGYSPDDAVALALRWTSGGDPAPVEIEAGGYLAQGVALAHSPRADPAADDGYSPEQLIDQFLAGGYTEADAALLADRWGVDLDTAMARAGSELRTVGALPHVDPGFEPRDQVAAADAFLAAGHDDDDAVLLADFWGLGTYAAKVRAGRLLLAGERLPMMAGIIPPP